MRALVVIAITSQSAPLQPTRLAAACQSQRHESKSALPRKHGPETEDARTRSDTKALVFPGYRSYLAFRDLPGLNLLRYQLHDDLVLLTFGAKEKSFAMSESEISDRHSGAAASYYHWGKVDGLTRKVA